MPEKVSSAKTLKATEGWPISVGSCQLEPIHGGVGEPLVEVKRALFNSAAIVERGQLVGIYRKQHLNETGFSPGRESPVFEKNGMKFGVNICFDANFPEAARALAARGAEAIFYPLNNNLPHETARKWRHRHIEILSARARECSVWVISSDVVARSPVSTGYGCTVIIDPTGRVIERCPELTADRICSLLANKDYA